jgi:diguanylate cyclase (GGDEF)-like protein
MIEDRIERRREGAGAQSPLFLLSFRHRDELSRLAAAAGWQPIAARRAEHAESRFVASGASVALVDARGALEEGRQAVRALADAAEVNGSALLVLVSRTDGGALEAFHCDGATHFLMSPFREQELAQALHFAARHAARLAAADYRPRGATGEGWRWQPGSASVSLTPALARQAGVRPADGAEQRVALFELFRSLGLEGARAARAAVGKAIESGEATAFAHDAPEGVRLAHHVRPDRRGGGGIVGRTEIVGGAEEPPATRDPLTGAGDARSARRWIEARLARKAGEPVVLLVSVSRFDAINAAFGRSTGDAVLRAAARRIERLIDGGETGRRLLARMAGAEFAVLLAPPASLAEGRFLASRIVESIARPFMCGDHVVTLGSRVGVVASRSGDDSRSLLRRASAALAEAKAGEAPVWVAPGEGGEGPSDERLEIDLRRALARGEIDILFQPQVSIATGAMVGAEALARWRHPVYGELGAATLFSVAERSDYLAQLSDHVQKKAIMAAAAWPEALRSLRLSVNITAADIARPRFAEQFAAMVAESGFEPARLTVEVTESGLIEDLGAAASLLASLREQGFRVAIDDFGTGYSSLAYLKALPLDYLKIDKSLSDDISGSPRDRVVVRSVIDMARSLGLSVIAEGVETEAQLSLLAEEGCNLYQGFLRSRPVSSERLAEMA